MSLNLKNVSKIAKKHKKVCISSLLLIIAATVYLIIRILKTQYIYIYILSAGLGNQMYMYAFGHIFELETGKKMLYDLTYFDYTKNKHEFNGLKYFNIDLPIASQEQVEEVLKNRPVVFKKGGDTEYHNTLYLGGQKMEIPVNTKIVKDCSNKKNF